MTAQGFTTLHTNLPVSVVEALREQAKAEDRSLAYVVRRALLEWVERQQQASAA